MSFKKLLLAAVIAVATAHSAVALAVPLDSISGAVEFKLSGVTTGFSTQADTNEVTWGLGNITQITTSTALSPVVLWNSGTNGEYLSAMLYGIADLRPVAPDLLNVGAVNDPAPAPGSGCGSL